MSSSFWIDLTIKDAEGIRDFYAAVIGWEAEPVEMDSYQDYIMNQDQVPVAGIYHARSVNAGIPPVWIPYFHVKCLEKSLQSCIESGGTVVCAVQSFDENKEYAVIQDPSGAVCAIWAEQ